MRSYLEVFIYIVLLTSSTYQKEKDDDEGRPYEFGFTIDGQQHRHEKKDQNGIIQGEFGFITADGVYHVTVYATDENGNFKILSMRNIRISAPLDGSPATGPISPEASKYLGKQPSVSTKPSPTQQPYRSPGPQQFQQIQQKQPNQQQQMTHAPFTTQPTIKPACGGCGYVTTSKPINGQKPFQSSGAVQQAQNGEVGDLNRVPDTEVVPPGLQDIQTHLQNAGQSPAEQSYVQGGANGYNQVPGGAQQEHPRPFGGAGIDPPGAGGFSDSVGGSRKPVSTLPPISVEEGKIRVGGSKPQEIPIQDKYPGMVDGLPAGVEEKDIKDLLYKFKYTVGFHGHYEKGLKNGAKIGGYFVNGRDGISRVVTYVADENGYRPKFKFINLGLESPDTPKADTEKTFGLKSFEFVWYPIE